MVNGRIPGTVNLLLIIGALVFAVEVLAALRSGNWQGMAKSYSWSLLLTIALYLLAPFLVSKDTELWVSVLFSMALVVPLGPMLYRLVCEPVAEASVRVLLFI